MEDRGYNMDIISVNILRDTSHMVTVSIPRGENRMRGRIEDTVRRIEANESRALPGTVRPYPYAIASLRTGQTKVKVDYYILGYK